VAILLRLLFVYDINCTRHQRLQFKVLSAALRDLNVWCLSRMPEREGYWQRAEASAQQEGSDHHEVVVDVPNLLTTVASSCSPRSRMGMLQVCSMIT